jgi:hypothetical protein
MTMFSRVREAALVVPAAQVLGVGAGCSKSPPAAACVHPCDLRQTFQVEIAASGLPAATIVVDDPCEGGESCFGDAGCRSTTFRLKDPGARTSTDGAPLVCHLRVVSPTGERVERDVAASYTSDSCCSGFEFSPVPVRITLAASDASAAR